MKHNLIILVALLGMGLASCDLGNDPAIDGTATPELNGEYFVELALEPGGAPLLGYSLIRISNTAANVADKIRIADDEHIWGFNAEFNANGSTFSGEQKLNALYDAAPNPLAPFEDVGTIVLAESAYPKYMTITDGKVISNAVTAPSAAVTDSIAFFASAWYVIERHQVVGHFNDTISEDPLEIVERNIYQFVSDSIDGAEDGPYFLSGYQRTGFLEDEH